MSNSHYPISGSCQCGQISYQLLEAPQSVFACYCRECQKLSTSVFSLTVLVKAEAVVFKGELSHWERLADSGNTNCAKFCPTCGNRIYHYNPEEAALIKLKPMNLSDTRNLKPDAHVWVSEKPDWYEIRDDAPQFQQGPLK